VYIVGDSVGEFDGGNSTVAMLQNLNRINARMLSRKHLSNVIRMGE